MFCFFFLQKKPRVVQSFGASSVTAAPSETRLSSSLVSVENSHSNSSNVVCTGKQKQLLSDCVLVYLSSVNGESAKMFN